MGFTAFSQIKTIDKNGAILSVSAGTSGFHQGTALGPLLFQPAIPEDDVSVQAARE